MLSSLYHPPSPLFWFPLENSSFKLHDEEFKGGYFYSTGSDLLLVAESASDPGCAGLFFLSPYTSSILGLFEHRVARNNEERFLLQCNKSEAIACGGLFSIIRCSSKPNCEIVVYQDEKGSDVVLERIIKEKFNDYDSPLNSQSRELLVRRNNQNIICNNKSDACFKIERSSFSAGVYIHSHDIPVHGADKLSDAVASLLLQVRVGISTKLSFATRDWNVYSTDKKKNIQLKNFTPENYSSSHVYQSIKLPGVHYVCFFVPGDILVGMFVLGTFASTSSKNFLLREGTSPIDFVEEVGMNEVKGFMSQLQRRMKDICSRNPL